MARTVAQVMEAARGLVQDQATPFRYSNVDMLIAVSDAVGEARRLRPDLFLNDLLGAEPWYTPSDMGAVIPLPDTYFTPLVNYVAGRVQLRDDEFSTDGRAVMLMNAFGMALTGGNRK